VSLPAPDHKFLLKYTNVNIYVNFGVHERDFFALVLIRSLEAPREISGILAMDVKNSPNSLLWPGMNIKNCALVAILKRSNDSPQRGEEKLAGLTGNRGFIKCAGRMAIKKACRISVPYIFYTPEQMLQVSFPDLPG
jgi:hypothetical protein